MISIIAVIGQNNELGKDNKLIWNLPEDLMFFKKITLNNPIVMGKNTFLSIGRPLPKRVNIVISRTMKETEGIVVCRNIDEIKDKYQNSSEEVYIIGGEAIYNYFINYAEKLYLTEVEATSEADVYFPKFNKEEYIREVIDENEENNHKYQHVLYRRK